MTDLKFSTPINIPKCTYCDRPAIYKRKTSGEYFCKRCFIQGFLRRLHRTIAKYSMLTPHSKILIPLLPDIPYTSMALIHAITKLEEKYPSEIKIVIPLDVPWVDKILVYLKKNLYKSNVVIYGSKYASYYGEMTSLSERYCLSRMIALVFASKLSSLSVLLPYNLDTLAILFLSSIISSEIALGLDLVAVKTYGNITLGYPFYDMIWEDIAFYNYINSITFLEVDYKQYARCNEYEKIAFDMYRELSTDTKELGYNILKNPRVLTTIMNLDECEDSPCPKSLDGNNRLCQRIGLIHEELRDVKLEILYP